MLSVFGLGLVSPAGASARDHVFFPRAEGPPPAASPFLGLDGKRVDLRLCPWLDEHFDRPALRLRALLVAALSEALAGLPETLAATLPRYLVLPAATPGLSEAMLAELAGAIAGAAASARVLRLTGAAGAFAALAQIEEKHPGGAVLIAADSFASVEALTERALHPPSPWLLEPPFPAEGAAALLVAAADQGARWGLPGLGEIAASLHAPGRATDDDDDPVDGAAMTGLLRRLPARGPIRGVFGQSTVGLLRLRDWQYASARCADRFSADMFDTSFEGQMGELGAAAGVASLALAFATYRHGAAPIAAPASFVCWAISRDGTRGIALGSAAPPQASALRPLAGAIAARSVERLPFRAPDPEAEEDDAFENFTGDEAALVAALGDIAANDRFPAFPDLPEQIAPSPLIQLDLERAPPISLAAFHASAIAHAAELAAALGRDRFEGPWRRLPETEARLLCQLDAIVAAGPRALIDLAAWWERSLGDPWACFAGALAAAAFAGDNAVAAIERALHLLPLDAGGAAITLTEALSLAEHPGLPALARSLSASAHPLARAVGLGLRGARGDLSDASILAAIADPADAVARAALWASERLPLAARSAILARARERCTPQSSPALLWTALRLLLLSGDLALWNDATGGALGERLGPKVAELFVLRGAPSDWPRLASSLSRLRPTRPLLSAVARFGCPAAAPFLIQQLADEAMAEHAAAALALLFGPIVAAPTILDAAAWRSATASLAANPGQRLRLGRPWSAAVVAGEIAGGDLSRLEVELRLDELQARRGGGERPDLGGLAPHVRPRLGAFLEQARSRG